MKVKPGPAQGEAIALSDILLCARGLRNGYEHLHSAGMWHLVPYHTHNIQHKNYDKGSRWKSVK